MTRPASPQTPATGTPSDWPDLALLVRHIIDTHHHYVRGAIPAITRALHRLVSLYGASRADLHATRQTFAQLGAELLTHMEKEEHILFPYIGELAAAHRGTGFLPSSPFGTVANPVRMMEDDHREALALMASIRTLTQGYTPPPEWPGEDAACYGALARFEADLRRHVELENTVLFPGALDLEDRLA